MPFLCLVTFDGCLCSVLNFYGREDETHTPYKHASISGREFSVGAETKLPHASSLAG